MGKKPKSSKDVQKKIRILEEEEAVLWQKTSKYRKLLDARETIPIEESEIDRQEVSKLKVEKPRGKFLEAHTYHLLVQMAKSRDIDILVQDMDPRTRLRLIGWFVRTRTTPLLNLSSPSVLTIQLLAPRINSQRPTEVEILEGQAEFIEPSQQPASITMNDYSPEQLERMKTQLFYKLSNTILDLAKLEALLTPLEGDLLSEMVNDKEIVIKSRKENGQAFLEIGRPRKEDQNQETTVLVIAPSLSKEKQM